MATEVPLQEADPQRALLDAAVACDLDLARVEVVARALGEVWLDAPGSEACLANRLPLSESARALLVETVDTRLEEHGGDARAALVSMGGPSAGLRRHLLDIAPGLSRAVTSVSAPEGPDLRTVPEGRYADFTPVGEGGMGIVYWALDTELSRQVAFKIVRPPTPASGDGITPSVPLALETPDEASPEGASFDGLRMRFLQEAWVTGGMEHPGIVPVYELGQTERGIPYYTMRFVRGSRTLDTAIGELTEAGPRERIESLLEPFLKICDTVRYAHSRGVIHRDLKCANVALGEYGEVVLLDWGLARVKGGLEGGEDPWAERAVSLRDEKGLHTVASAVGTPGYMSPEAARGESDALDERSDVYTLGVLLFRILTGRLPFPVESGAAYLEQVLTEDAPDPTGIHRDVPAGLAHLCRRALARAPADRPPTADAFADAVRAWRAEAAREREVALLLGEAKAAIDHASTRRGAERLQNLDRASATGRRILDLDPDHTAALALLADVERLRETGIQERERQARRRVLRRAGAVALGVAVVAGIVVAWLLEERRQEAEAARLEAQGAQARAESVMNFMVFELQSSLEPIGRLDVLAKIGITARSYYASLPDDGLSPESLVGHTVALRRLGDVYEARGDLPAALEAYRLSGDVAQRILAVSPGDAVGRFHRSLAKARVGYVVFRQGYASDAKRMFLEHQVDVERLLEDHPDDPEYRDALASAHAAIGTILRTEGAIGDAGTRSRRALAIGRAIEADHPDDDRWTRRRIERQLDLVHQLWLVGDVKRCRGEATRVLEECRRHAEDPVRAGDVRWQELEAEGRYALSMSDHATHGLGVRRATDSLDAFRALLTRDPSNDRWRRRVAQTLVHLGDACRWARDLRGALAHVEEAYAIGLSLTEKDPTNATWHNFLITACDRMASHGKTLAADPARIADYRRRATEHARRLLTLDPTNAKWQHILAFTLSHQARTLPPADSDAIRRLLMESVDLTTALIGPGPAGPELAVLHAETRRMIAILELLAGHPDAALRQRRLALDVLVHSWRERRDRIEVLQRMRLYGNELVTALIDGDAEERAEAAQRIATLRELAEATLAGPASPDQIKLCESWLTALDSQREALEAAK